MFLDREDNLSNMDEKDKEIAALKAERDAIKAENGTLKARCDAAEAAADPKKIEARVKAGIKLREDAR